VGSLRINVLKKRQRLSGKLRWELKGVCFQEQLTHKEVKRGKILEAAGRPNFVKSAF